MMVCTAGATLNERTTGTAAENTVLPAWLAVTLQLPTLTRLSTVPLTVHTAVVVELKLTARPEVAVATRAAGCTPRVWLPGELKLMVCARVDTVNVCNTAAAAAKFWSPAWLAATVQLPLVSSDRVVPVTLQTLGVVEANDTGRPEEAVATRATGAMFSTWVPGDAKEMFCAWPRELTVKVCTTGVAAR